MSQPRLLRCAFAALASFILYAGVVTLPFAAVPVAAIGLAFGLAEAALAAAFALLLTGFLLSPPMALVFALFLLVPTLALIRRALMSRADPDHQGQFQFYPPRFIIEDTLIIVAMGAVLVYLGFADYTGGLPKILADTMYATPEVMQTLEAVYGTSTFEEVAVIANWVLITGFASWPILMLGGLQIAQAGTVYFSRNLRPTPDYKNLTLPTYLTFGIAACFIASFTFDGWLANLALTIAAIAISAYFLLGLAIIHAISRHWKGRALFLTALYFFLLMTAWVIIPVSLMGLLDGRFNFRRLPRNPDKSSD